MAGGLKAIGKVFKGKPKKPKEPTDPVEWFQTQQARSDAKRAAREKKLGKEAQKYADDLEMKHINWLRRQNSEYADR